MTSTKPIGTIGSIAFLLAATLYQGNPDRNHKLISDYTFRTFKLFFNDKLILVQLLTITV
jgi:hypothetical protein